MVAKQLIVTVEGTAAIGPFWQTIVSDYLDKIIRCFCGNEATSEKPSTTHVELSLVIFKTHGSYSDCLVQRSGWTRNIDTFFQWLSAIRFTGGGFDDAAIAEGLAETLKMFSFLSGNQNQNLEGERHCILVAASNPYPLPSPVYRLADVETLANCFAQCAISLSIICPRQLPKLRGIYNAAKRDPRAEDMHVDDVKNPHFLVLISEDFTEARSVMSSGPSVVTSMSQQTSTTTNSEQIPYVKFWKGHLYGKTRGKSVFITELEGHRSILASETLGADWPPIMRIVRVIPQYRMKDRGYVGHPQVLIFRVVNEHGFLAQLKEKKLSAVVELPSHTVLLSASDNVRHLLGWVFPAVRRR